MMGMLRTYPLFLGVVFVFLLAIPGLAPVRAADAAPGGSTASAIQDYKLGAGDKVRVTVVGQTDLSGEFTIEGSGFFSMPLIGPVKAGGLSAKDIESGVTAQLKDGFLNAPRVNVEVTSYRPFYIIGEVSRPGQYPYVNGMTVLNAIALAGGYTERARTGDIDILRSGQTKPERLPIDQTVKIFPDDVLTVRQRYF
jgi:polysaccharide biosynthesis/export protein VpsN